MALTRCPIFSVKELIDSFGAYYKQVGKACKNLEVHASQVAIVEVVNGKLIVCLLFVFDCLLFSLVFALRLSVNRLYPKLVTMSRIRVNFNLGFSVPLSILPQTCDNVTDLSQFQSWVFCPAFNSTLNL